MPVTSMLLNVLTKHPNHCPTGANITRYNTVLAGHMVPLSALKEIPPDLSAVVEANGDVYLRYSNGEEAEFAVIGVVCGACLVAPSTFPK